MGTIWVHQLWNHINNQQNRIKMIRFCEEIQSQINLINNRKKSSNDKQKSGKPHKQRTFRILMWSVITF